MLVGQGLHTAAPARVTFARANGPVRIAFAGGAYTREELQVGGGERSTSVVAPNGARLGTVEHLFAALAGLGVHEGLVVDVDGPEVPLLDGGARAFADAVAALALPRSAPRLRVVRAWETEIDGSRYRFEPGSGTEIHVTVDFGDRRLDRDASWSGDPDDFVTRIAPARTFGFEHEVASLLERGLASHVAPESVVVVGEERILCAGRPFTPDEPARHKLLDLIGDLFLHGGPPVGRVTSSVPGHMRTHRAMRAALTECVFGDAFEA